jgi:CAAX protease family protein
MIPISPTPLDHALALVLAVFFPLRARTFGYRRLEVALAERLPEVRLALYREAIALQWLFAVGLVVLWIRLGRPLAALGLGARPSPWFLGVCAMVIVLAVLVLWQRGQALRDDAALASVRARLRHVERMLPHSSTELRWFYWLSATAGVCEELLYRGYLIAYLAHWLPPAAAAAVAALAFGIGHSYQGARGVLTTTAAGAILGFAYLVSGSLLPGMVAHALGDAHSGHLAYVALRRRAEAAEAAAEPADAAIAARGSADRPVA